MNILVHNLPKSATEDSLRKAFEKIGNVRQTVVFREGMNPDKNNLLKTPIPKGTGFVEMKYNVAVTSINITMEDIVLEVSEVIEEERLCEL